MNFNESFGKIENFFNKIPSLEIESSSDNNSYLFYDYNIKRNIEIYDQFNDYERIDQVKIVNSKLAACLGLK